jgi:hypothetical protein
MRIDAPSTGHGRAGRPHGPGNRQCRRIVERPALRAVHRGLKSAALANRKAMRQYRSHLRTAVEHSSEAGNSTVKVQPGRST